MEILEAIKARRSIRKFMDKPLTDEELSLILQAGAYAPSGGNSQSTHFIVLRGREKIDALRMTGVAAFAAMDEESEEYRGYANAIKRAKNEGAGYDFTYGAPVFVLLANRKDYGNAMADCALAAENMFLQAAAMGIGSCYVNQIHWLTENDKVNAALREMGMKENETVFLSVALGYSAMGELPPLERFGNPVTYVD